MIFPEGYGFISLSGGPEVFKGYWYEGENTEARTEVDVEINTNANGLEVNPQFPLTPGKTYTFVFPEGQIVPRSLSDRRKLGDTSNATYTLTYYTPAVEDINSVTFEGLKESESSANRIEKLSFKINPYMYKDVEYNVMNMGAKAILYVNDKDTATAEYPLDIVLNGTEKTLETKEPINLVMMQGSTYRFVIPENKVVPMHELFRSLGGNKETSFVYTGTTPTVEYVSLSYTVDGEVTLKTMVEKGKPVTVSVTVPEGRQIESVTLDGTPLSGEMDVYTIPALTEDAGLLVKLVPVVINRHNVTLSIDNAVAQTSAVEEGKTVSFQLTPVDDLWKVESVENATLDAESGKYVTEPVKADVEVKAVMALAKPVDYDFMSGIEAPAGCPLKVSSEGDRLIIAGVQPGDNIRIYTVGGSLMANLGAVPEGSSIVSFSLAEGVYIIAVNDTTLKVKH